MSNMYPDVDKTINFIGGKCPYNCSYCYVEDLKRFPVLKKKYSGVIKSMPKEFKKPVGKNKFIFVGSCIDMFAKEIHDTHIIDVINHLSWYDNTYLFQTKNPERFLHPWNFPQKSILGTTIETNRDYKLSKAPTPKKRMEAMVNLKYFKWDRMISLEPLMDFDLKILVKWIKDIKPKYVSIGADSKGKGLEEPSPEKIKALIKKLNKFTEVKIKDNLKRLL